MNLDDCRLETQIEIQNLSGRLLGRYLGVGRTSFQKYLPSWQIIEINKYVDFTSNLSNVTFPLGAYFIWNEPALNDVRLYLARLSFWDCARAVPWMTATAACCGSCTLAITKKSKKSCNNALNTTSLERKMKASSASPLQRILHAEAVCLNVSNRSRIITTIIDDLQWPWSVTAKAKKTTEAVWGSLLDDVSWLWKVRTSMQGGIRCISSIHVDTRKKHMGMFCY